MLFRPLGFVGPNLTDYDAATNLVVDAIYDRMLQKAIAAGKKDLVIVTGPPACGKTLALNSLNLRKVGLIFDADLSEGDKLIDVIAKAQAAGIEKITLVPVYNDPMSCYKNCINRGNQTWRYTTMEQLVGSFRNNVGKLVQVKEQFADLEILPVNCSNNQGVVRVEWEDVMTWNHTVTEEELNALFTYLLDLLNNNGVEPNSVPAVTGNVLAIETHDPANQALAQQIEAKKQAIMQEYKMR